MREKCVKCCEYDGTPSTMWEARKPVGTVREKPIENWETTVIKTIMKREKSAKKEAKIYERHRDHLYKDPTPAGIIKHRLYTQIRIYYTPSS